MLRVRMLAVLVLLSLLAVAQNKEAPPEKTTLTADEYEILSAALHDLYPKEKVDRVVLINQTGAGVPPGMAAMTQFGNKAQEFLKEIPKEMKDGFQSRNRATAQIDRGGLKADLEILLLDYENAKQMVEQQDGWDGFKKQYPHCPGITLLALPAVNVEGNQAMLYVGNSCGMLCGEGKLIMMTKKDGRWALSKQVTVWVS